MINCFWLSELASLAHLKYTLNNSVSSTWKKKEKEKAHYRLKN